jgi:hypothetical protein
MQTKDLEIPKEFMCPEWQTNKVKIRKWSLGIRNEILDQTSEFTAKTGRAVDSKIKGGYTQILTLIKCVVEAPWKIGDISAVNEFDTQFGDWLYEQISELNGGNKGGVKNPPQSSGESLEVTELPQ